MARKRMNVLQADKAVSLVKDQQNVEGFYIGYRTITTDYGPAKLHHVVTDTGTLGVYGFRSLDNGLQMAADEAAREIPGKSPYVFLAYAGTGKAKKGFRPPHLATVDSDLEITMDGDVISNGLAASEPEEDDTTASSNSSSNEDDSEDSSAEEHELHSAPVSHVRAAASQPASGTARAATQSPAPTSISAEQQAKTRALLERARANSATRKAV